MALAHLQSYIASFLTKGNTRSLQARKNVVALFVIRALQVLVNLFIVRYSLAYLNETSYGIWITLFSVITWFALFDVGLGHGLRNKLTAALAVGDTKLGRSYVSTTYALLGLIFGLILLVFFALYRHIPWTTILNAEAGYRDELNTVVLIVFGCFFIRFIFENIRIIYLAKQQPAFAGATLLFSNLLSLVGIILLSLYDSSGSLVRIGLILSISPLLVFLVFSLVAFTFQYPELRPSFKAVDWRLTRDLTDLGFRFFLIQVAAIVLYQTNRLIIAHLFGPAEVTPYFIALQYVSVVILVFSIFNMPVWSAATDAFVREDYKWLRKTERFMLLLLGGSVLGTLILYFIAPVLIPIWINKQTIVPQSLVLVLSLFAVAKIYSTIYTTLMNGIGKIKLSTYTALTNILLYIPVAIFLARIFGIQGIVYGLILSNVLTGALRQVQFNRVLDGSARGIWNQ